MNYQKKLEQAKKHAQKVEQKKELHDVRHSKDIPREKLSFSKIAFIFMMTNCVIIEIYSLVVMVVFQDLSSLPALIAAVVGECVSMAAYFIKSDHENTTGGIVYESAMAKLKHELDNEDAVG